MGGISEMGGDWFDCNYRLLTVTIEAKKDGSGYFVHEGIDI